MSMNVISRREQEIMDLVVTGLRSKIIAEKLFVCEKTIKFHLTNIYKKMKVKSRAELIVSVIGTPNKTA